MGVGDPLVAVAAACAEPGIAGFLVSAPVFGETEFTLPPAVVFAVGAGGFTPPVSAGGALTAAVVPAPSFFCAGTCPAGVGVAIAPGVLGAFASCLGMLGRRWERMSAARIGAEPAGAWDSVI